MQQEKWSEGERSWASKTVTRNVGEGAADVWNATSAYSKGRRSVYPHRIYGTDRIQHYNFSIIFPPSISRIIYSVGIICLYIDGGIRLIFQSQLAAAASEYLLHLSINKHHRRSLITRPLEMSFWLNSPAASRVEFQEFLSRLSGADLYLVSESGRRGGLMGATLLMMRAGWVWSMLSVVCVDDPARIVM